ncbi:CD2 antigen cytoplasmic tail-binding protein 2 [Entomortierella parvispora]|uniref:CD2 antigen cytoplasmic tail-binding protein 2 n=1 Tax=Entomortierella parvispora TaxID=205924 RepID=A0A9P3H4X8_9FUNG|nr:CD2 antigen cytoplasmic tail-binding protein 2 [Entomortierella parvispora]
MSSSNRNKRLPGDEERTASRHGGSSSNNGGPSKRVRFGAEEEVDDTDLLEQRKARRGAVTVVKYDGGEDSSEDEDENSPKKKKISVEEMLAEEAAEGLGEDEPEDEADELFADPEDLARREAEKRTRAAMKGKTKQTIVAQVQAKRKGKKKLAPGEFDKDEIEGEDLNLEDLDDEEYDSEGNPKIEAFNMKEELEEGGEIDASGNFIRKLDPDRFHDSWLEGLSRKEIEAARQAHDRKIRQQKEEEREAARSAMTETDIYLELANILTPGESVLEAIQRLGGGAKKRTSAANKGGRKKYGSSSSTAAASSEAPTEDSEEQAKRKQAIEKLTDLCDKMMAMGHFNIYEETYEQAVRNLRRADIIDDDWIIGTPVLRPEERAAAAAAAMLMEEDEDMPVQWEYRWASPPEGQSAEETFGPFSAAEMKSWWDQGFFSQGILVRMVGDTTFEPATASTFS